MLSQAITQSISGGSVSTLHTRKARVLYIVGGRGRLQSVCMPIHITDDLNRRLEQLVKGTGQGVGSCEAEGLTAIKKTGQ
jgi:hypothetical protein